jgi:hypothetical protein
MVAMEWPGGTIALHPKRPIGSGRTAPFAEVHHSTAERPLTIQKATFAAQIPHLTGEIAGTNALTLCREVE